MAKCSCGGDIDTNVSIVSKRYAKRDPKFENLHECLMCGKLHHEDGKLFITTDAIWGIVGDKTPVYLIVRKTFTDKNKTKSQRLFQRELEPCTDKSEHFLTDIPV